MIKRKILSIMLVLAMFFSVNVYANDVVLDTEKQSLEKYSTEYFAKQEKSGQDYNKLIDFFNQSKSSESKYPEFYGGSFVDTNGDYLIHINEKHKSLNHSKQELSEIIGNNNFKVLSANYSYNELEDVMNSLNSFKINNPNNKVAKNFNTYWLSDIDNSVIVELDNMTDVQITLFKDQVLDSPIITFKKSSGIAEKFATLNPGQRIDSSTHMGSMGYRAKKGTKEGIVTAAHLVGLNDDAYVGNDIIGDVTASQESGPVDASFVEITHSSYTPSNVITGTSNVLSTVTSQPGVGTIINKVGTSSGHTSGRILSTNLSKTIDGINHTNLTSADFYATGGDSGGIVYSYISSTNTRYTLGIILGGNGTETYFSKADEINSALGISRY